TVMLDPGNIAKPSYQNHALSFRRHLSGFPYPTQGKQGLTMKTARSELGLYDQSPSSQGRTPEAEVPMIQGGEDPFAGSTVVSAKTRASIRILVVDDDRTLREGCASLLQVEGYSVTVSGRGDEAVELLRRAPFDIVLVDLCMTPVSGVAILKAALEVRPDTIVVMMTGNPSVASSVETLRMGAWDYIPKPFSGTHLQVLFGRAAHAVLARREED